MRVLVTGGTGKIGRGVVAGLGAAGCEAVPASRHGTDGVALDLLDAASVEQAAQGFTHALLVMPVGPEEEAAGPRAVAALRRAGVGRIVAIGIHNAEAMQEIPHFAAKLPMAAAVLDTGGVVLACNFFQQNDLLVLPAILHAGVFPLPVGASGVFAVDVGDVAAAAVHALVDPRWSGTVPVCGPERLTGADYADHWSAATGRLVRYGGDAIDPFIAAMAAMPGFDAWMEHDFRTMMRVTQALGCPASDDDLAQAAAIVGRPLARHLDFAARTVAAFKETSA